MTLLQDFRFAVRSLRSHFGTAAFATLTLAIGLGAALSIYAVIDAVLLRELPYPQADRLVEMGELSADGKAMALAYPNYSDLVANDAFAATAFYNGGDGPVSSGSTTRRAYATFAGGDFFRTMATAPQLGRTFDAGERQHVAVISHALWQGLMQGRADVIGQPIDVAGEPATIVGVMPPAFDFPEGTALWDAVLRRPRPVAHRAQSGRQSRACAMAPRSNKSVWRPPRSQRGWYTNTASRSTCAASMLRRSPKRWPRRCAARCCCSRQARCSCC